MVEGVLILGIYLNPGNAGFKRTLRSQIYVDKTGLLEYTNSVLESEDGYICVSRPRRFGKSITAEMLVSYYGKDCDSKEMFQNLNIAKAPDFEEHLNRYDVIHVDMNDFRHRRNVKTGEMMTAEESVIEFQTEVIRELKEKFPDSVTEQDVNLPVVLARINNDTGAMFVIIIDEWDTIFREDKLDVKAQESYINLLRGLFKDATSKRFLKLAYITGILPVKKYGTQSALNNFKEFTMINPGKLAEYVGFTEEEVQNLCEEYNMDFAETKRWYDGYSFRKVKHIYSPNSVVNAMLSEEFDTYWTRTETYESLKNYICMNFDGLKDAVVQMLAGGRCKIKSGRFQNDMTTFKSKDDVLTLLIHLGYLAYDIDAKEVYIPNEEVRDEFNNAIADTGWTYVINAIEASDRLLKATWQMDCEAVANAIDKVHMENTSILQYNDENALSCVISLAYYNAINEYTLIREMPTGKGYADVVFLPRLHSNKPAMVVELKYNQSVDMAIHQIRDKQYIKALEEYKGRLLLVAINYDKNTKEHQCRIEEIVLE